MKVLVFCKQSGGSCKLARRLNKELSCCVRPGELEYCPDIETLCSRMKRPRNGLRAAVLVAGDRAALDRLVEMRDLISDLPVILLLPDRERETVREAHKLYPRLLSYVDGDMKEVGDTLGKMLRSYESSREQRIAARGDGAEDNGRRRM